MKTHQIGFYTALAVVIANMIGTGVFTSLGFQVIGMHSGLSLLMLWIIGGVLALCGALTYSEIGAAFPENGGEYHYLSKLYHPAIGFLSGWVSVTVGFAAPIAAAAMALAKYSHSIYAGIDEKILAISVILIVTSIHTLTLSTGGKFQKVFTLIKVIVIGVLILSGLFSQFPVSIDFTLNPSSTKEIFSSDFAVSLIYVTYAYSGWNAAAYIAGELKDVNKNLPRALLAGTGIVLLIYTLLNYVFLKSTGINELSGQVEVGLISAKHIFGETIGNYMGLAIAILLVSTISAMIIAGPRVMESMGKHYRALKLLSHKNKNHVPVNSIVLQSVIAILLITISGFESLINYIGFTLNLFTFLTVLGIFILRYKMKNVDRPFKTPLFPLPPVLFLLILLWILINVFIQKPAESMYGLLTVAGGLIFYFISKEKIISHENN